MKFLGLVLISILSLSFGQDRSTIFNAGPPSTQEGFLLSNDGENGTAGAYHDIVNIGERKWVIDIEKGKYPNRKLLGTSQEYGPTTIWKKIAEYQKYYYDKYKNT